MLENESFNVFCMRCGDHDIMTYAVGLYLMLSFWLCLKDTISMYLVSTRLVLLWQHVHVPIIYWVGMRLYLTFFPRNQIKIKFYQLEKLNGSSLS